MLCEMRQMAPRPVHDYIIIFSEVARVANHSFDRNFRVRMWSLGMYRFYRLVTFVSMIFTAWTSAQSWAKSILALSLVYRVNIYIYIYIKNLYSLNRGLLPASTQQRNTDCEQTRRRQRWINSFQIISLRNWFSLKGNPLTSTRSMANN